MEETTVINLIAIETVSPKWRMTRSAGAVYAALIVLIIGCISVGNLLYERFSISRHITQPILYAGIAIVGYYIYRRHYLRYRYTLTNEMLAIEQLGGRGERTLVAIDLADIRQISREKDERNKKARIIRASLPPQKNTTWIQAIIDGEEMRYAISASDDFLAKLTEHWNGLRTKSAD